MIFSKFLKSNIRWKKLEFYDNSRQLICFLGWQRQLIRVTMFLWILLRSRREKKRDCLLQPILSALLDRLANFSQKHPEKLEGKEEGANSKLVVCVERFVQEHGSGMKTEDMLVVKRAQLRFILEMCNESQATDYISTALSHLAASLMKSFDKEDRKLVSLVTSLVAVPVGRMKDVVTILELKGLKEIFGMLPFVERKSISLGLANAAVKGSKKLSNLRHIDLLFEFLMPLLVSEKDYVEDQKTFEDEQTCIARLVHVLYNDDTDTLFKIFSKTRKVFGKGGEKRIKFTLPPLVFEYLELVKRIFPIQEEKEFKAPKVFQYIIEILNVRSFQ